jgi:hypothetical protein
MLASVTLIGVLRLRKMFRERNILLAQDDMGVGILRVTPILDRNAVSLGVVRFDPPRKRS